MKNMINMKAPEKIWKHITEHVVPYLLGPEGIESRGKAWADVRAYEILAIAQAEKDAQDIREGRARLESSVRPVPTLTPDRSGARYSLPDHEQGIPTPIDLARATADLQHLQQYINLARTVSMALEEAESIPDERVSDDPVDPDWFTAWRDGAQRVSNEDMRVFWARILAGEAAQPNKYRLRTLETLRNLSRGEATLIEQVAPLRADNSIPRLDNLFHIVPLSQLLELSNIGILSGVEAVGLATGRTSFREDKFEANFACNDKAILDNMIIKLLGAGVKSKTVAGTVGRYLEVAIVELNKSDPHVSGKTKLPITKIRRKGCRIPPSGAVTRVGQEIMSLGRFPANMSYLDQFISNIKEQGFSLKVGELEVETGVITNIADK